MEARVRAIRGATTLDADTREQMLERVGALVRAILERNELEAADLVSMIFTATEDISAEFPAAAARAVGLNQVPLLCARELSIEGAVERCVRVLLHAYTTRSPEELRHVYLERAEPLRTDLPR